MKLITLLLIISTMLFQGNDDNPIMPETITCQELLQLDGDILVFAGLLEGGYHYYPANTYLFHVETGVRCLLIEDYTLSTYEWSPSGDVIEIQCLDGPYGVRCIFDVESLTFYPPYIQGVGYDDDIWRGGYYNIGVWADNVERMLIGNWGMVFGLHPPSSTYAVDVYNYDISPDGHWMVAEQLVHVQNSSRYDDDLSELILVDISRDYGEKIAGKMYLTRNDYYDGEVDWSPTGEWIAYVSAPHGIRTLHLMTPDGETVRQLTRMESQNPIWSPNAQYIAYVCSDDIVCVYDMQSQITRVITRMTYNRQSRNWVRWSPTGEYFIYWDNYQYYRVDVDTWESQHFDVGIERVGGFDFRPLLLDD